MRRYSLERFRVPGGPTDPWTVVAIRGAEGGSIRIDGQDRPLAGLHGDGVTLRAGAHIELPESTAIELRWNGVLAIESAPGAGFSLPRTVRDGGEGMEILGRIEHGEVRYLTGPAFRGSRLSIESHEARVEVVGTTFSVIRDSSWTCVCVEQGIVRLSPLDGKGGWEVPAGRRRQVFDSPEPSLELPLRPGEGMKLQMFRDRALPTLDPTAH